MRVLEVGSGAKLTLNNLTVANGRAAGGAGIHNNQVTVTFANSTLSGNSANGDGGYYGGGIESYGGSVTLQNTIVQDLVGNRLDQNGSPGGLQQKTWAFTTKG